MGDDARKASETISIANAGEAVSIRLQGASTVTVVIEGDAAADYEWDVRTPRSDGGEWKQDIGDSYTGAANYDDVRQTGAGQVRVRCASGTETDGDEATITLLAGG